MSDRCEWATADPLLLTYHDREWGVPQREDRILFEYLLLDGAQAGLSWLTILRKREHYRQAFAGFDPVRVAEYDEQRVAELLANPGIVRNRAKVTSAIGNARAFRAVQDEFGSFAAYVWRFVGDQPRQNAWQTWKDVPAYTAESQALSKDLIRRGFRFVGPTIIYAFMQGAGLVNDHVTGCFRQCEVARL